MPSSDPAETIRRALADRGSRIRDVRFRHNRSVLLSVSRDGTTLNCHACFRDAPPDVVDAIAAAMTSRGRYGARGKALRTIREWEGTRRGLARARARKPRRRRSVNGPEPAALRRLFDALNAEHFGGRLPGIPLRISRRMTRTLGTVRYGGVAAGDMSAAADGPAQATAERTVTEIAISADLLKPSNEAVLLDTMLHEMAHAEAWLDHGHRGHGRVWKEIARRVGCRPKATNDIRVEGRGQRVQRGARSVGSRNRRP